MLFGLDWVYHRTLGWGVQGLVQCTIPELASFYLVCLNDLPIHPSIKPLTLRFKHHMDFFCYFRCRPLRIGREWWGELLIRKLVIMFCASASRPLRVHNWNVASDSRRFYAPAVTNWEILFCIIPHAIHTLHTTLSQTEYHTRNTKPLSTLYHTNNYIHIHEFRIILLRDTDI